MNLAGSLEAFGLPDILQLLASTSKTGALHLRGPDHGVVRLQEGRICAVTTGRAPVLARRLSGSGVLSDDGLAVAVRERRARPDAGYLAVLEAAGVDSDTLALVAADLAAENLAELLDWTSGSFDFHADEPDPDPLGVALAVTEAVTSARARSAERAERAGSLLGTDTVYALALGAAQEVRMSAQEWRIAALADGARTVEDLAALLCRPAEAVAADAAALAARGLLVEGEQAAGALAALLERQQMLAELDSGGAEPAGAGQAAPIGAGAAPEVPRRRIGAGAAPATSGTVATVTEQQLGTDDDDAAVTKSLLLRLIAGVRAL